MPSRYGYGYGTTPDIQALMQALLEQERNTRAGTVPSSDAFNRSLPRSGELEREAGLLAGMDKRWQDSREDERKRQSIIENQKAGATLRNFETRTGVAEEEPAFPSDSPSTVRSIRRFSNSDKFTDPESAMTTEQRSRLDPRVIAEQERSRGDIEAARIKASGTGNKPSDASATYAMDTAKRTIQAIDEVLPDVNWKTAGAIGSVAKFIGGTEASDVSADLSSVASNVAFNALRAMRDASKTGGALGQVSDKEIDFLTSVEGSIRQNQSPENLRKNLKLIRESQQRFIDEAERLSASDGPSPSKDAPNRGPAVGTLGTVNGIPAMWDGQNWVER